jgi:hypothetical protein
VRGERDGGGDEQAGDGGQRRAGRPHRAGEQHERRTGDEGQLGRGRLGRVRGVHAAVSDEAGDEGAQARPDRRHAQAEQRGQREERRDRRADGHRRSGKERRTGHDGGWQQHDRVPAAVHDPPEQRAADAERAGEDCGDEAGGGERAGQPLGVHQQADAEHRQRQSRDDREDEHGREHAAMVRFTGAESRASQDAKYETS